MIFADKTKTLFKNMKDKISSIDLTHKELYEDIKPPALELEYNALLKAHRVKSQEFNHVDCNSANFDALCSELQGIDYRLKQVKQEMRESQK